MINTGGARSIIAATSVGVVGVLGLSLGLFVLMSGGPTFQGDEMSSNLQFYMTLGYLWLGAYIVATIFVPMWFHRAYRNTQMIGANGLKFTPGWAAGAFFVPILSLYRPYQVAKEIWQGSDPTNLRGEHPGSNWLSAPSSPMLFVWWFGWIVGSVRGSGQWAYLGVIGAAGLGVSAVALIYIMRTIDARQRECMEILNPTAKSYADIGHTPDISKANIA